MTEVASFDIFRLMYLVWTECDEARFAELYRQLREIPSQEVSE